MRQAVEDLQNGVVNILQFVIVDLIGIIISAGLCYKMAGFNIFKALGYLQKEYGMMLAVSQVSTSPKKRECDRPVPQAYLIIHNCCVTIVACALDLTFKFNWVLDAGSGKV